MRNRKFGVIKLILLCFVVAVVASVPSLAVAKYQREKLEQALQGTVSAYQGVINIWNVDTFESGSQSKVVFLENATTQFSKKYNGLYFLIKNISVEEMVQSFLAGVYPDVISFGFGVGDVVRPVLENLSGLDYTGVRSEILTAGQMDGNLYAVGYLMGGYILATTEEKLLSAGISNTDNLSLCLNSAGFDTESKNKKKHTYSVVVGDNKYVVPQNAVSTIAGVALTDAYLSSSMYDAYMDFVAYNIGTILIGTQRDLFKLSGRVSVGKISGVKIEYLQGYTNLVQYVGVVKGMMGEKLNLAKEFTQFLVSSKSQQFSSQVGMVSVIKEKFYTDGEFKNLEESLHESLVVENLF